MAKAKSGATPSTPSAATPKPKATPKVGSTLDLSKYPKLSDVATPAPDTTDAQPAREQRERVSFGNLAGIAGLKLTDVFEGNNDEYGPFMGGTVVFPDGAEALALTSVKTAAGGELRRKLDAGAFDTDGARVAFHVVARKSRSFPDGRPMALIRWD
jgi:hypothetical protein